MNQPKPWVYWLAATGLIASLVGSLGLFDVLRDRFSDFPDISFGGWQVDVVEGALGALLLGVLVSSGLTLHRHWASQPSLLPLALVPGLLLGAGIDSRVAPGISWLSERTAAARHSAQQFAREREAMRRGLVPWPSLRPAAPGALARHLLRPADFGSGWFDAETPNPSVQHHSDGSGTVRDVMSRLVHGHKQGEFWVSDWLVSEDDRHFSTRTDALRYLTRHAGPQATPASVGSVRVWVSTHTYPQGPLYDAIFAVGADVFHVITTGRALRDEVLPIAVRRATSP